MEGGAVRVDGQGLLDLCEGLGAVSVRDGNAGEQGEGIGVLGVDGEDGVGLLGGLGRLSACDQNVAEVDPRRDVAGLKIDGVQQLGVSGHHRPLLDEDFRELVVGLGEVPVDLEGVGELDGRLFELALAGIAFAAFEVPLFFLVGIAMTTHGQTKCKRYSQDC